MWNERRLKGRRKGRLYSLWLKTDMIGATEVEESLSGFKLSLNRRMLEEVHEFTEELSAQSQSGFILQINVAILALIWAIATIVALGDISKARGLVCPRKTRVWIGNGRRPRGWITGVSRFADNPIHGSECGALHRLQKT